MKINVDFEDPKSLEQSLKDCLLITEKRLISIENNVKNLTEIIKEQNIIMSILLEDKLQPERSKREDSLIIIMNAVNKEIRACQDNLIDEMRCSELYGDIERPAEKIWPA